MNASLEGIMVLGIVSIFISIVAHYFLKSYYFIASMLAGLVSIIFFIILSVIHSGYLDPFFIIVFIIGGGLSLLIAFIVGIPFAIYRRRKGTSGS